MAAPENLAHAKADFAATAELSKTALAKLQEHVAVSHLDDHRHGGCGCA
jgi:hypothetical protein